MPKESKETVPFMRPEYYNITERYPKGRAPDQIPTSRIANLGMAYQIAKEKKLLPPGLDTTILAMSILEGRSDYGGFPGEFPINSKNKRIVEALFGNVPAIIEPYVSPSNVSKSNTKKVYRTHTSDDAAEMGQGLEVGAQLEDAKLSMLKLAQYASKGTDEMVRKYNGTGKAKDIGNKKDYIDLVKEIRTALETDPANKQVLDLYNMITAPVPADF